MRPADRDLLKACEDGNIFTVEALLEQGADPNCRTDNWPYPTALMIAAKNGYTPIVALLIQHGADPRLTDDDGENALHYAVSTYQPQMCEYLITKLKIDPNSRNHSGITPFLRASARGNTPIIQFLVDHGADPFIVVPKRDGVENAIDFAILNEHCETARELFTKFHLRPNCSQNLLNLRLIEAAKRGDIPTIQLLVQLGANPHLTDYDKTNPLHHAVENRQYETTQYLITQLQVDPNIPNGLGCTPFMIAVENGDIKMLRLLIELGANPHLVDHRRKNALHYAVLHRHGHIVEYLITELNLDCNAQDCDGITPFMLAAYRGDADILQRLVQLGTNPHITDKNGRHAIYYAVLEKKSDILQYLSASLKLDPNTQDRLGYTPLLFAFCWADLHTAYRLVEIGADPYTTNRQGQNILHYAAEKGDRATVCNLIICHGLDPDIQDHYGYTPLILAAINWDRHTIMTLIQLGANPYLTDKRGRTALHHAAEHQCSSLIDFLVAHLNFDPNAQDHDGNTPLHLALERGFITIAKRLIRLGANPHIPNLDGKTPAAMIPKDHTQSLRPQPSTITL